MLMKTHTRKKRFVKFTGSSVLIFQIDFLVDFTRSSVQSTDFLHVSPIFSSKIY